MTVYFSKTQHIEFDHWEVTIAPASIRKGYTPEIGDTYLEDGVVAIVNYQPVKNTVVVRVIKGIPCVGRAYNVEKK